MNGNATGSVKDNVQIHAGGVYNQSGGTLDFKDLLAGAGTFNQTGSAAIVRVERNWQMGAGSTFYATAGTIEYTGTATSSNYAAGTRQFANVLINAGENPGFSMTAGSTIPISGNFTNNNTALTNTANATFNFNGSGNQSVFTSVAGTAATLGNVTVNKTGGTLSGKAIVIFPVT